MEKIKTSQSFRGLSSETKPHNKISPFQQFIGPRIEIKKFRISNDHEQQVNPKIYSFQHNDKFNSQSFNYINTSLSSLSHGPSLKKTINGEQTIRSDKKTIRQNGNHLKQIITEQKIKQIVRNFIKKVSQNNIHSKAVDYTPFLNEKQLSFMDNQGIQLNDYILVLMSIFSTIQIVGLTIMYTLSIVFQEVDNSKILQSLQTVSLVFYIVELAINLITVKFEEGKRLGTLRTIFSYCLRNTLTTDVISIIIIIIDLLIEIQGMEYIRLFIMLKLGHGLEKLEKLEIFFIHNFYYEQYWSLLKVFIFNFSLAHFLAIFLIGMASINPNDNWMNYKDIILAPWPEKYAWAYYWATTIMLTVGFGDLAATNYQEAIVLTMIEMISCITLAYNINCVGTLISNIRQQDLEKGKNFKIFYKLSRKNDIPQDLEWRINNYIEESSNIKKKFNYEEENLFVENLPNGLKTEFLKESHKKIFQNLPFFKHLMQKTLFNFAQKIEMHICHPEEIIQHIDEPHNLLILKGGEVGFTCKKNGCDFNNTVVDKIKLLKISEPLLLSLGFINTPRLTYEIKSLEYSILYFLNFEKILQVLKENEMDHELYCLLRDKSPRTNEEFQLFTCEICQSKHTKFTCPKLHYVPFKQQIASRYTYNLKYGKCVRDQIFTRFTTKNYHPLKIYKEFNFIQETSENQLYFDNVKQNQIINVLSLHKNYEKIDDQPSNQLIKEISDIKDFFSRNTAQLIKHQVSKAFNEGEGRDEVWIINLDKVKNYKSYFEGDNSCNLKNKFFLPKRWGTIIKTAPNLTKMQGKIHDFLSSSSGMLQEKSEDIYKKSMKSLRELFSLNSISHHKIIYEKYDF